MSDLLAKDLRTQYGKAFQTVRGIVEAFPEARWLEPHGDEYYIPCRIGYHIAVVIDRRVAGGYKDKDFDAKLPYGRWTEATEKTLPAKKEFLAYLDGVLGRADKALAHVTDEDITAPVEEDMAWMGASKLGLHLYLMRELSDHTGELNKMLIEDGGQDVWIAR